MNEASNTPQSDRPADSRERFLGYPVRRRPLELAGGPLVLYGPANFEELIDDPTVLRRFEADEFLPYWAEFWPGCLLLADLVESWPATNTDGRRLSLLELGAGLGLVGLVASRRGFRAMVSDYDDDALAFVRLSAERNQIPAPETRFVDWRLTYPDLQFDRIVGAEVLYEKRHLEPVAQFIANHLTRDGAAAICDANRQTADGFPDAALRAGLSVAVAARSREYDGRTIQGRVFTLKLAD
ncbi:MAG: hypothetical protein KDA32_12655 [Phycisphaerales bacterium]|nr:hypothetical protein [Phycisphaerales bacterium]